MKPPRLNMWQRLGVVASVLWMVGGGVWRRMQQVDTALAYADAMRDQCGRPAQACARVFDSAWNEAMQGSWPDLLSFAAGPVLLGWALVYAVVWTIRWVGAGRAPAN